MPHALHFLVLALAGWVNRHQEDRIDSLREEHRVLREHLGPRPLRLTDAQRRRRAVRGQKLGRRIVSQGAGIVTPDTILRWYRRLIAQQYDGRARRCRRRPMTPRAVAELVGRMAGEHPMWGYTRIRGALANLGHNIAWNTVNADLARPRRGPAVGRHRPDVRRHATLPQSWIHRENWEFETHTHTLDTQARYVRWQTAYRALKQRRPQMSDVWYARQIAKQTVAAGCQADTIRRHMTGRRRPLTPVRGPKLTGAP